MFRDPALFLLDIFIAIKKIQIYTRPFDDADAFYHAMAQWDATIRQFEIIGEAANYLIKSGIFDEEKRVIVDFRNILIHKYFGIDPDEVWEIVQQLGELEYEIVQKLHRFTQKEKLIIKLIEEYHYQPQIVAALKELLSS